MDESARGVEKKRVKARRMLQGLMPSIMIIIIISE